MTRTVRGAAVLITGAAQGMGRLYAERAVAEGARSVVLWDRDAAALAATVAALGSRSRGRTRVQSYVLDVGDLGAIAKTAQKVRKEVGNPDILINNAGVVRGDRFFWEADSGEDTRPTMLVNALAPLYITREFLPGMIARAYRQSRIVNIASAAGMIPHPRRSVYAASKAAVIGWSESLRLELLQADHANVKVTTVCPGPVAAATGPGRRGTRFGLAALDPEHVVDRVWKAMLSGRPMLTLPWTVGFSRLLNGLGVGRTLQRVAAR